MDSQHRASDVDQQFLGRIRLTDALGDDVSLFQGIAMHDGHMDWVGGLDLLEETLNQNPEFYSCLRLAGRFYDSCFVIDLHQWKNDLRFKEGTNTVLYNKNSMHFEICALES
jgi:hypothetical protein